MKDQRIALLGDVERSILKYKGFPLLQEEFWVARTEIFYALREEYGTFPTWTPYGYVLEEIPVREAISQTSL